MSSGAERPVRLVVDENVCLGSGICEMNEEETFAIDEETAIAAIVGDGLLPVERAEAVVDSCPAQAISIAADHGE
jgi:ferredoxin